MKYKRVGVLLGGLSNEREVSLASGTAVAQSLERLGYDVVPIDATHELDMQLREAAVDVVFLALHGKYGEDGTAQGMLELMKIPYTASGPLASSVAMDKVMTNRVLKSAGLPVAQSVVFNDAAQKLPTDFDLPVVVKPANEGSSVGVSIVKDISKLEEALKMALKYSKNALVEKFVSGTEIQVAILEGEPLGSVEIESHSEFYDYKAKYSKGGSTHHIPPRIPKEKVDEAEMLAKKAYHALGCAGAARVDLIVPKDAQSVILEVNTIPGMTQTSLLPEIAAHKGISFDELISICIENARLHVS